MTEMEGELAYFSKVVERLNQILKTTPMDEDETGIHWKEENIMKKFRNISD